MSGSGENRETMPAPPVRLLEFDESWLDELSLVWPAALEAALGMVDPHPVEQHRPYFLTEVLPRTSVRLATLDDCLVGFVAATPDSVAQLHVRLGYQRRGIGTGLLDWAKSRSSGSLWLRTFARNHGARAFYERNGFVAVAFGFDPEWRLAHVRYEWSESGV
jgi:GNAT superfamily N-acetyltransferase